jgi:hypothetical protein
MPNFAAWLGNAGDLAANPTNTEAMRAVLTWRRILDKPSSIVFRTPAGSFLSAQTVRLETDSNASPAESAAGLAPRRRLVIFGVKNYPLTEVEGDPMSGLPIGLLLTLTYSGLAVTIADTIIEEGYRFILTNDEYRVVDVLPNLIGEIQAVAEATG